MQVCKVVSLHQQSQCESLLQARIGVSATSFRELETTCTARPGFGTSIIYIYLRLTRVVWQRRIADERP
ncbi:hypothetical protein CJ179_33585 [Rhodococcus sp. ACS1]|uniref:Uncharacterized protein n=1 Tax=Rhodococcus koreensis TaxID=99653 RepID=A0A1H4ICV0_9NOCA|nr:hypothetical protein CJ179_33585 [Rhodococcus sp. ACS1]SEB31763.1 hypothetical protein SAMN04490239_0434 [Rhodococcus koreensis]